ncbi:MAG: hypothetical protein IJC56_08450 [Clostridia bacterium]|nr:hypothetical protein [Clostridia bacterium]
MGFLRFADDAAMYDSTPLDNMFIIENLPSAPEAFLKVYIYARMLCMHPEMGGMDELSRALKLDQEMIENAFAYWERAGFMRRVADNPPEYVFMPTRGGGLTEMDRDYYMYRDFNGELQSLFPEGKLMHPAQYALANDWLNVFGFTQDAVIAVIKHFVNKSKAKKPDPAVIFKSAEKKIIQLANIEAKTLEKVVEELNRDEGVDRLAKQVLFQFGQYREPTAPEKRLAEKWLKEWKLTPEQVIDSIDATVKATNPSFAYLNTILANRQDSNGAYEKMQAVLRTMGARHAPAPEHVKWYEETVGEGFEHETIELAARQLSRRANPNFGNLTFMINKWRERGILEFAKAEEFVTRNQALLDEFTAILLSAEIEKRPTEDDLTAYAAWKQQLPLEVVQFAAECCKGRSYPITSMKTLVERFIANGVTTLEAAKALMAATSGQHRAAAPAKQNPALNYQQRTTGGGNSSNSFMEMIDKLYTDDADVNKDG